MTLDQVKAEINAKIATGTATETDFKFHELFTIIGKSKARSQWTIDHPLISMFWKPKYLR